MSKKCFVALIAIAMVFAMSMSTMAQQTIEWKDGIAFHCGHGGNGNGKVDVVGFTSKDYDAKGPINVMLEAQADGKTWLLLDTRFACTVCGNDKWVSYSNKSGVPNGKNIQMTGVGKWEPTIGTFEGEDEDEVVEEPAVVNLGFIGYYVYDGTVMSTSFYWQQLQKGDMIDWDAVDAAYGDWEAKGGLKPKREWVTSGYDSFAFDDRAPLGFDDFTPGQIEAYYFAYFVDPGYELVPDTIPNSYCRYYAICQLYNDLMWGNDGYGLTKEYSLTSEERNILHLYVGLPHRAALLRWWYGSEDQELDVRYIPFSLEAAEFAETWANNIYMDGFAGISLQTICLRLGIDVDEFIEHYDTDGFLERNDLR